MNSDMKLKEKKDIISYVRPLRNSLNGKFEIYSAIEDFSYRE